VLPSWGVPCVASLEALQRAVAAGPLELILFDDAVEAGWSWSQRDEAMAPRILADAPPGTRTLAVAGNARTPTGPTSLGVPMGACLARHRPGVREICISYGGGRYYNLGPRTFGSPADPPRRPVRLHLDRGALAIDLPAAGKRSSPTGRARRPRPGCPDRAGRCRRKMAGRARVSSAQLVM
jgi:hypothetical protein